MGSMKKHWLSSEVTFSQKTRDAFPTAKVRKEGFQNVFNVWVKSHFSNFELG